MFSRRITNSARFLKMTADAQLLYFHLCLAADDDGIVEAFAVRNMVGAKEDTFANLQGRGFITILDAENEIILINDWLEHNRLRADRITPSIHRDLLDGMDVKLIEPKQRADRVPKSKPKDENTRSEARLLESGQPVDSNGTSQGQQVDSNGTVMGRLSIGKDSIVEDSIVEDKEDKPKRKRFVPPSLEEVESYVFEKNYNVDAERFVDFYTAKGWMVGKNKMKDWKAAVRNWNRSNKPTVNSKPVLVESEDNREYPF